MLQRILNMCLQSISPPLVASYRSSCVRKIQQHFLNPIFLTVAQAAKHFRVVACRDVKKLSQAQLSQVSCQETERVPNSSPQAFSLLCTGTAFERIQTRKSCSCYRRRACYHAVWQIHNDLVQIQIPLLILMRMRIRNRLRIRILLSQ